MKYTLDDFIKLDIVVKCDYTEAKLIANKLRKEDFNTTYIDDIEKVTDPIFYLRIYKDTLCKTDVEYFGAYELVSFENLELSTNDSYKSFEVGEIVHAVMTNDEVFNPFARIKHVTAYVACVDKVNHMCELVYLHNVHDSVWLNYEDIFHIESIYNEEGEWF